MLLVYYMLLCNVVAFAFYGVDKYLAVKGKRRVPERRLLFFAVIGGVFGAGLGMLIFRHKIRKRRFIVTVSVSCVVYLLLIALCLFLNLHLTVTDYEYRSAKVPADMDGFRIVQISDLHNQRFGSGQKRLLAKIREIKPDIIVVTGDVVDSYHTNYGYAKDFFEGAARIAPVYYITGNHETWLDAAEFSEFLSDVEACGVTFLDDRAVVIGGVVLSGLADASLTGLDLALPVPDADGTVSDRSNNSAEDTSKATVLQNSEKPLQILLAHEPAYFERYRKAGADLILTGHVHGGQIIIPGKGGLISPDMEFFPELYEGVHEKDGSTMVISRGLGNSILPLRINNFPEIVTVTLRHIEE